METVLVRKGKGYGDCTCEKGERISGELGFYPNCQSVEGFILRYLLGRSLF